jgi:hypothetical protein
VRQAFVSGDRPDDEDHRVEMAARLVPAPELERLLGSGQCDQETELHPLVDVRYPDRPGELPHLVDRAPRGQRGGRRPHDRAAERRPARDELAATEAPAITFVLRAPLPFTFRHRVQPS